MEVHIALLLIAAGLSLGFINNLAGAAGAIGLVALESLLGMETMEANASLRLSALAIGLAGLIGFRSKGHKIPGKMWGYSLLTIPGAIGGAFLVHQRFELLFRITVAVLLCLVLLQQLRHKRQAANGVGHQATKDTPWWLLVLLFSWLGTHMGFVQIATGLVAIFILSMVHSRDLLQINTAKMSLVLTSSIASTLTMVYLDRIAWTPAILLAIGAGIGSFSASRWSVAKGHGAVRVVVVVICVAVLARLGYQFTQ